MDELPERRLPVYLVLDTSGSMRGEPIELLRHGIDMLVAELRSDPHALETAFLSIIIFNTDAQQISPLTEILAFQPPYIMAGGNTSLGKGLRLLLDCLDRDVRKSTASQKGDWRPLVFLMTDGHPTDGWKRIADEVKGKRLANIIACAAGPDADPSLLKRITDTVVVLDSIKPDDLKAFFKWVSASVQITSRSVAQNLNAPINLPPPPPQIHIIP